MNRAGPLREASGPPGTCGGTRRPVYQERRGDCARRRAEAAEAADMEVDC